MVVLPTFAYDFADRLLIFVHAPEAPADDDWSFMLRDTATILPRARRTLVVAGNISLSTRQTLTLIELLSVAHLRVAVLSDASLTQRFVTALDHWERRHKGFASHALDDALIHLDVPELERPRVRARVSSLRVALYESRRRTARAQCTAS
jgi:hypothetical protein